MLHAGSRHSRLGTPPGPGKYPAVAMGFVLALMFVLLPMGTAFAQVDDLKYKATFGLDYSNGSYGTDRNTDVELGLTTLSAISGNLKVSISVPYMRIAGRGLVIFDAAGNPEVINRKTTIAPDVRTGFGDLNLSATYTIPPDVLDGFELDVTARAKAPTASTRRRLGTGAADFGGDFEVSRQFGIWDPFISIGYLFPGQPSVYSLNNTASVSTGTSLELTDHLVAIGSYDYDSPSSPLLPSSQEAFGSLSWLISDTVTLTGYSTAGLSSGSPKVGGGLLVSYDFN
jgi:hypothetical protein